MHAADWNRSSTTYANIAARAGRYSTIARALVSIAAIKPSMTVLDLGSGTGSVIDAIQQLPIAASVRLIALDSSIDMLRQARQRWPAAAQFVCASAENLSGLLRLRLDRVLCNAALWQMDMRAVLAHCHHILKPGGRLLASLPAADSGRSESNPWRLYATSKLAWMLKEQAALYRTSPGPSPARRRPSTERLSDLVPGAGFAVRSVSNLTVQATARDTLDFLKIPAISLHSPLLAGLDARQRAKVIAIVEAECVLVNPTVSPKTWTLWELEKL